MPNHVTNILKVRGQKEKVIDFFKKTHTEKCLFDFNTIVPMPDYVYSGDLPGDWKPSGKYTTNWYNWCPINWGTKWNAYDCYKSRHIDTKNYKLNIAELTIVFDTARSTPFPIWEALALQYPDLLFDIKYADEDIGNNCGIIKIKDWKINLISREDDINFAKRVKERSKWNMFEKRITDLSDN